MRTEFRLNGSGDQLLLIPESGRDSALLQLFTSERHKFRIRMLDSKDKNCPFAIEPIPEEVEPVHPVPVPSPVFPLGSEYILPSPHRVQQGLPALEEEQQD
jgi:hypothetical protein